MLPNASKEKSMSDELRKYIRLQAKDDTFAALFLPDNDQCLMLGKIIDISEGGLGICHIDIENRPPDSLLVSIYGLDDAGIIDKIPCKIVYDMEIPDNPGAVLSPRRCGIRFEPLSEEQEDRVKEFMKSIGTGTIEFLKQ